MASPIPPRSDYQPAGAALYADLDGLSRALMDELSTCREAGQRLADAERDYRKRLRLEILSERRKGTPVTIISDVCRGVDEIADLKCARDCAEALYKASQEAINVYKIRMRMLDAEIQRAWTSGGMQ